MVIISPLYTLLLLRYGYIQQFVNGPTATPTHAKLIYDSLIIETKS
jgi:hypothetical protein